MNPIGLLFIASAIVLPFVWLGPLFARDPLAMASQSIAIAALIAMAITQILALRIRAFEALFGGMDQIYRIHKWLGLGAMVAILLHDTIDADMTGIGAETLLTDVGETLGEISLYGLLILVTLTLATFVPYHLWRWTHKIMGTFFVFGAVHYLLILKPFSWTDPVGLYTNAFCLAGTLAYLWTLRPQTGPGRGIDYTVTALAPTGDALSLTLTPNRERLNHRAGQFVFLRFRTPMSHEPHPFTLSSAPRNDGTLRVTIKDLGDFTSRLRTDISVDAPVRVEGPFGRFTPTRRMTGQIWVAAGIGITPFVAWAEARDATSPPAHLFYSVRSRDQAPHLDTIERLAASDPTLTLTVHETATQPRLTAQALLTQSGIDAREATVAFCGPTAMARSLKADLVSAGLPARRFKAEAFEIRTGLPVNRWARWAMMCLRSVRTKGRMTTP